MTRGLPVTPLHVMTKNGFYARLMKAQKLTGNHTHGLPPGQSIPVFQVDAFLDAPKEWVKGAGSYVCPVESEWGLWFDWTMNDGLNTAVIPSVKGMNPITGAKIQGLALERYSNKCPIHDKDFVGDDRLCEECGYNWPPQNYVCAPNTLWWDGFRAADGTVRQFFFSKEDEKDIASAVIGKHNTVPAFGFCFYRPKKPVAPRMTRTFGWKSDGTKGFNGSFGAIGEGGGVKGMKYDDSSVGYGGASFYSPLYTPQNYQIPTNSNEVTTQSLNFASFGPVGAAAEECNDSVEVKTSGGICLPDTAKTMSRLGSRLGDEPVIARGLLEEVKAVSVGAGAKINQILLPDQQASVKSWRKKDGGIIRLYFVFEAQFSQMLKGGFRKLSGEKEGYLKGLPVGE